MLNSCLGYLLKQQSGSVPSPERRREATLLLTGGLQCIGNKNLTLTVGKSRVVESPTPLEEAGSRALAVCRHFSTSRTNSGSFPIRARASFCKPSIGPCLWLPPKTSCTQPLRLFLQVVSPEKGGPTSPLWAEPHQTP